MSRPSINAEDLGWGTGLEYQGALYNPQALAMSLPDDKPVVFIVGAMATGNITINDHPYVSRL